jgi:hypothetical protein
LGLLKEPIKYFGYLPKLLITNTAEASLYIATIMPKPAYTRNSFDINDLTIIYGVLEMFNNEDYGDHFSCHVSLYVDKGF